jgi:heme-degrading monooxygenase HmoA
LHITANSLHPHGTPARLVRHNSQLGKAKGFKGSYLLRRKAGDEVEFITIMLWDSINAIRAVAGSDYETAVVPEERRKYLAHYEQKSTHYEIVSTHQLELG